MAVLKEKRKAWLTVKRKYVVGDDNQVQLRVVGVGSVRRHMHARWLGHRGAGEWDQPADGRVSAAAAQVGGCQAVYGPEEEA